MSLQETLKALADPIRRQIVQLLKSSRLSAGDICEHFSISAAAISRHLSILKDAGLVRDMREGKYIFYEVNLSVLEELISWLIDFKGDSK